LICDYKITLTGIGSRSFVDNIDNAIFSFSIALLMCIEASSFVPFAALLGLSFALCAVLSGGFREGPSRLRPPPLGRRTDAVTHGRVS